MYNKDTGFRVILLDNISSS